MFKVGDIVRIDLKYYKNQSDKIYRYKIKSFSELIDTAMLEDIACDYSVETMIHNLVLDTDYIRKMKIKKICSKLGM